MTQSKKKFSRFGEVYVSYGSYHNNTVNKFIHIIFVPIITGTLFSLLSYIPLRVDIQGFNIGVPQVFFAFSIIFYLLLNLTFAIGMIALSLISFFAWKKLTAEVDQSFLFQMVLAVHIISWIAQFIGHGVFEKRKPALMDNFIQVLSAPLFVIMEVLDLCGVKLSQMEEWQQQIDKNVAAFKLKNKQK